VHWRGSSTPPIGWPQLVLLSAAPIGATPIPKPALPKIVLSRLLAVLVCPSTAAEIFFLPRSFAPLFAAGLALAVTGVVMLW
jgi:hypothetical protein